MKNLIKKILREDFDWIEKIDPVKLGEYFDEDDISYDDYDATIYLGVEGKVTYNLSDEEVMKYVNNGQDDWVLNTLIKTNGNVVSDNYSDEIDYEEVNYLGSYLTNEQIERLQKILNYYKSTIGYFNQTLSSPYSRSAPSTDVKYYLDENFSLLGGPLLKLYMGRHDWDDFANECLSSLSSSVTRNRWVSVGNDYNSYLEKNDISINSYWNNTQIELSFPYKGVNNLSVILDMMGLGEHDWSDNYWEDWDTSGSEEDIRFFFDQMLNKIEESIDEKTNT